MDGAAPAAAAAIEHATGIAVDEIPATPERLLAGRRVARAGAGGGAAAPTSSSEPEPGEDAAEEGAA